MEHRPARQDEDVKKCFAEVLKKSKEPVTLDVLRENCRGCNPPPLAQSIRCILDMLKSNEARQRVVNDPLSFAYVAYIWNQ